MCKLFDCRSILLLKMQFLFDDIFEILFEQFIRVLNFMTRLRFCNDINGM